MNDAGADEYDPYEHVPERITALTAGGLAWLDDQLHEQNKARLRSLPIGRQVNVLAELIEAGAIGIRPEVVQDVLDSLDADSARERDQEADR